ncbi:MAG: hypothetical protein ABI478_14995 [Propionivibrio sp.]
MSDGEDFLSTLALTCFLCAEEVVFRSAASAVAPFVVTRASPTTAAIIIVFSLFSINQNSSDNLFG